MPRLEEILATLAALPGARAAVLAGFDGLLVDEAVATVPAASTVTAAAPAEATTPSDVLDTGDVPVSDTQVPFGDMQARADEGDGSPGAVEGVAVGGVAVGDGGDGRMDVESTVALDGAVVELTHAWNGVRRACAEYLAGGAARELIVMADDGIVVAQVVADAWFVFLWATPDADLSASRTALREAAYRLSEVVR